MWVESTRAIGVGVLAWWAALRQFAFVLIVVVTPMFAANPVVAMSIEAKSQALRLVADFTDRMCMNFSMDGSSKTRTASASAGAELSVLLRAFLNIGVSVGGRIQDMEFVGLLQKDLVYAMGLRNECKKYYFVSLSDMLLSEVPVVLKSEIRAGGIYTETIEPDGRRCIRHQDARSISESCDFPKEGK